MAGLVFIPNVAGEGEGLSDAGIETYRDNPFPAVARETSQNSRDAQDKKRVGTAPVEVVIDKLSVPTSSFPSIDEYRRVVECCLEMARKTDNLKEIEFFQQARRVLAADKISVLRIADYNTKGLRGPCVDGSPFHALVKSSGVSTKDDPTAGGSFGIGKSAVYSASDLQTVFYSTLYKAPDGAESFLCQGKTKFRSFDDGKKSFRSVGYWGEPAGFMPVHDVSKVPAWLRRDQIGTTVCSIAVRDTPDWQNEIIASLIVNFFSAIHTEQMKFSVDGIEVSHRTLKRYFSNSEVEMAAKEAGQQENFSFARAMYQCLQSDDAIEQTVSVSGAGAFRVRVLLGDKLPKRVGILRNGMLICDSMAHFKETFARFPMYRDFVAIVEPEGEVASAWLRQLENPRHDELSPERVIDPTKRAEAKQSGMKLAKLIREAIKSSAKVPVKEQTELEELSEFFAMENAGRPDDDGTRNPASFRIKEKPTPSRERATKAPPDDQPGDEGGGGRSEDRSGGHGTSSKGAAGGSGTGGTGTNSVRRPLKLLSPRVILAEPSFPSRRQVMFTPETSGLASLEFECSGLSEPERLAVIGEPVRVACVAGKRQSLVVEFSEPYDGPIEILSWTDGGAEDEAV